MKMLKHFFFLVISAVLLNACSLPNKKTNQELPQPERIVNKAYSTSGDTVQLTEAGLIRIQRHSKEYSISMLLDASDDNIYFEMELPESAAEPEPELVETISEAVEDTTQNPLTENAPPPENTPAADPGQASKFILYAQTYFFENKYSRALDEVNRAIEVAPGSAIAHSLRGSILYKQGKQGDARQAWETALELDPNLENVKAMLERTTTKTGS